MSLEREKIVVGVVRVIAPKTAAVDGEEVSVAVETVVSSSSEWQRGGGNAVRQIVNAHVDSWDIVVPLREVDNSGVGNRSADRSIIKTEIRLEKS
jgi:hypothetical protein